MRPSNVWALVIAVAIGPACSSAPAPSTSPAPSGGAGTGAAATSSTGGAQGGAPGAPGAPNAGPPRRRPPPNPVVQDSIRRSMVDSILRTIAGRENQPAGKVFKNVVNLKDMPAGEFLRNMDVNYGRGLGWTCNNCHIIGKFDDTSRKNKRIALQMQVMTDLINEKQLTSVKELDEKYDKVSCVMCHRGTNEPKAEMAVPPAPTAQPATPPRGSH
jgi:hypothetical protein